MRLSTSIINNNCKNYFRTASRYQNKIDKFALWFSGYTLFINNNDC